MSEARGSAAAVAHHLRHIVEEGVELAEVEKEEARRVPLRLRRSSSLGRRAATKFPGLRWPEAGRRRRDVVLCHASAVLGAVLGAVASHDVGRAAVMRLDQ